MSEIPEDCVRIAKKFSASDDVVMATAAAIWSERQRCAKIADDNEDTFYDQYGQGWNSACFRISQAILNQTEE